MTAPSTAPNPMSRAEWLGAPHPETVAFKQSVPCTPSTSATIPPAAAPITAPQSAFLTTVRCRAGAAAVACESVESIAVMARLLMAANGAMRCGWRGTAQSKRCVAEGTTKFHDSSSGLSCAEPEALVGPSRRVGRCDVDAKIGQDTRRYLRWTGVSPRAHFP